MDDERRNRTDLNWTIETEVSIAQGTTILCRNSNGDRGETQRIIWGEEGERIEEQREREKRTPYVQCRLLRAVYPYTGNWKGKHERRPRAVAKPYLPIHDDYTTNYELRFSPSFPTLSKSQHFSSSTKERYKRCLWKSSKRRFLCARACVLTCPDGGGG